MRGKDVEVTRREIVVRAGKDRVMILPVRLAARLQTHLKMVKAQHDADLALRRGEVWLPDALAVKSPNAAQAWGWQSVFPAVGFFVDPRSGAVRRHHLDEKRVQAVKRAAPRAEIVARTPCAIRLPRLCLRTVTTSTRCKSWAIRTSPRP